MILSICDLPDVLNVMRIVNIVITIIKVVVPIILIVSAMIDLVRAVSNSELNKITKPMVNKVIAAALIFLIPTFVRIIARVTLNNGEYEECLGDITLETITVAYDNQMEALVKKAEESKDTNDYSTAQSYLSNIEDEQTRKSYEDRLEAVKKKIDEEQKAKETANQNNNQNTSSGSEPNNTPSSSANNTGYGKNVPITNTLRAACNLVLNDDKVKIRLTACEGKNALENPSINLPGGATRVNGILQANETISFAKYRRGMFTQEIGPATKNQYFFNTFFVMYTGVFLNNVVGTLANQGYINTLPNEISVQDGTCFQVYWESTYKSYYDSGAYRGVIDNTYNNSRYYILTNSQGGLIDVRYDTHKGILDVMDRSAAQGKDVRGMIEDLKSGHGWAGNYSDAIVYDCRNLL